MASPVVGLYGLAGSAPRASASVKDGHTARLAAPQAYAAFLAGVPLREREAATAR